jgi:hypothetical protein
MTQLQQLQAAIQHAIQYPPDLAARAGSTQHADASLDEASQQPLLLTFQIETCTQLVALATAAAEEAAAQVTQHGLQAPTGTSAGAAGTSCSGAAEVQKVVLQASTAWIKDLATRLAHYTCRYLFDVLKWQSGWSLRQVRRQQHFWIYGMRASNAQLCTVQFGVAMHALLWMRVCRDWHDAFGACVSD